MKGTNRGKDKTKLGRIQCNKTYLISTKATVRPVMVITATYHQQERQDLTRLPVLLIIILVSSSGLETNSCYNKVKN